VRYKDGVGLELKTSPPSNLVEPVMLGPNGEFHSMTVANNTLTLVKLNADTTPAWTKTVTGGITPGYEYDVDAAGNIILLVTFSGSINFGAGPLTASAMYNMALVKLNPSGNVIWQKRFDSPAAVHIARAGSGDIAMTGCAMPTVDLGAGPVNSYFAAEFDSSGNVRWTSTAVGGTFALAADNLGGVYVATMVGGGGYNPFNTQFSGRGIAMVKFKECSGPGGCKAYGAACTTDNQCGSGICADGVCCDSKCEGTCYACSFAKKGYGEDGVCQVVAAGNDPDNDCPTGACNASGKCVSDAGITCTKAADCLSGFCADGVCCNETCSGICRACTAALKGSGNDGSCENIVVGTDPQSECFGGYCSGAGACAMGGNGAACTANSQCASGNCADGVCCDSACSGTCDACTAAKKGNGSDGTCGPIANGLDPDNECANGSCDGASVCKFSNGMACGADAQCLSGYCVDGVCCSNSCNGTCVACSAAKKGSGQDGVCGNIVKNTDPDAECGGSGCNGLGDCFSANGDACSLAAECASNNCRDGVCCDNACAGVCMACSAAKKGQGVDGTCGFIVSGADPDGECLGSHCEGRCVC